MSKVATAPDFLTASLTTGLALLMQISGYSMPANSSRRSVLLLALCLSGFTVTLTYTGIGVAIPEISRELDAGRVAATWVINAFVLVFGACVMAAGTLADRYGRKRVMVIGVLLYVVTSAAAAMARNILLLDLLRGLQGAGAALTMAAAAAAVAHAYQGAAQVRAFALLGTCFGAGFALGPIVVGFTVQYASWRLVFLLGAILGAAVLLLVYLSRMAESKDPEANSLDVPGTLGFMLTLTLFTYGLIEAPERGLSDPVILFLLGTAAISLMVFIAIEKRQQRPMLDLGLFKNARFIGVQALPIAAGFSFIAPLALLPFRFIGVEGMSEGEAGLALLPLCLPMVVVPLLASYLARWIEPGALCALGLAMTAMGLTWLAFVPIGTGAQTFVLPMLLVGVGISLPWGLMDGLAVAVVPAERSGMAVGIFGTSRLVSEGTAIVVVTAILLGLLQLRLPSELASNLTSGREGAGQESVSGAVAEAYHFAFRTTFLILAGITSLCAAVSAAVLIKGTTQNNEPNACAIGGPAV